MTENVNRNIPPELSDNDAELLSAYIDDMLTAAERDVLEKRLGDDAFLRSELAAMRQTVLWLNQMPQLQAPRNFTISAEDVAQDPPSNVVVMPRRNWWLSAAAAAVVVVIFGAVFVASTLVTQNSNAEFANEAMDSASARTVEEQVESTQIAELPTTTALPTDTTTATSTPQPTHTQTGFGAATAISGGATMPVLPATTPIGATPSLESAGDDDYGVAADEAESDDALATDEPQETANAEIAQTQAISAMAIAQPPNDVFLTATALAATVQAIADTELTMIVSTEQAEVNNAAMAQATSDGSVMTATITVATAEAQPEILLIESTATASAPMMLATATSTSSPPPTMTPQPTDEPSPIAEIGNVQMTATALVEIVVPDVVTADTDAETATMTDGGSLPETGGAGGGDITSLSMQERKQIILRMRQFLYNLFLDFRASLGDAP